MQPTRLTLGVLVWLVLILVGFIGGLLLGKPYGFWPATVLALLGAFGGLCLGGWLDARQHRAFCRRIEQSSDAELAEIVAKPDWNFSHTFALLTLLARGEKERVRAELPRVLTLLESDSWEPRAFGWDALRIVFIKECELISDYNPRHPVQQCRDRVARLRTRLAEEGWPPETRTAAQA